MLNDKLATDIVLEWGFCRYGKTVGLDTLLLTSCGLAVRMEYHEQSISMPYLTEGLVFSL